MLMFITILLAGSLVVALFAAIASSGDAAPRASPRPSLAVEPPRFFAGDVVPIANADTIPLEALLSQIECHVRLEQAAAERYVNLPSLEALRSLTSTPLVN